MLKNFVASYCVFENGQRVLSSSLYKHFTTVFCPNDNFIPSNKTFTQWVQKEFPLLIRKHTRNGQAWFGLTLKDSYVQKKSGVETPEQLAVKQLKVKNYQHDNYIRNKERKAIRKEERKSLDLELVTRCGLDHSAQQIAERYRKWKQAGVFAYEYHPDKQIDWELSVRKTLENRARWNISVNQRNIGISGSGSRSPHDAGQTNEGRGSGVDNSTVSENVLPQESDSDVTTVKKLPLGVPQLPKPKSREAWCSSSLIHSAGRAVELNALATRCGTPVSSGSLIWEDSDSSDTACPAHAPAGSVRTQPENRVIKLKIRKLLPLVSLHSQLQQATANKLETGIWGSRSGTIENSAIDIQQTEQSSTNLEPSKLHGSSMEGDTVQNTCLSESTAESQPARHLSSGCDSAVDWTDISGIAPPISEEVFQNAGFRTPGAESGDTSRFENVAPVSLSRRTPGSHDSLNSAKMDKSCRPTLMPENIRGLLSPNFVILSEGGSSTSTPKDLTLADYARLKDAYIQKREALSEAHQELLREAETPRSSGIYDPNKALQGIENQVMKLVREWGKIRQPEPEMPNLRSPSYDVTLISQVDVEYERYLDWYSEEEDRLVRGYIDETMSEFLETHGWQHRPKQRETALLETSRKMIETTYRRWSDRCV